MKTFLAVAAGLLVLAGPACKKDSTSTKPTTSAEAYVSFSIGGKQYKSEGKSITLEIDSSANVFETGTYDYTYTLLASSADTANPYALQLTTFFEEGHVVPGTYTDTTNEIDGFQYYPSTKNTDDLYASSRASLSVTEVAKVDSLHFEGSFHGRVTATTGEVNAPYFDITSGQVKLNYSAINIVRRSTTPVP